MILNKSKKIKNLIILYNKNNEVIYEGTCMSIPYNEDTIIKKCIEFFDDSSPCFFHKTAAVNRISYEIECYLKEISSGENKVINIDLLSDNIKHYFKHISDLERVGLIWE